MSDVDGCVADVREIASKHLPDWTEYFRHQRECSPIAVGTDLIKGFIRGGASVIFVTGRPESVRKDTEWWLREYVTADYMHLLMRCGDFVGSTQDLKLQWLKQYSPTVFVEDDPAAVRLAVSVGFAVLQVHGYRWSGAQDYSPNESIPARTPDGHFSFVQNSAGPQTPDETLHVMTYELGKVIEYHHKSKRYGETAYYNEKNQRKEMSDLISMCRMYCEQRGWDYEGLEEFGEVAYLERMDDLRKYGLCTECGRTPPMHNPECSQCEKMY